MTKYLSRMPSWSQIRKGTGYILINFATPMAFYVTFQVRGAKPAIAFAIGVTLVQVIVHWIRKIRFSPFFIIASGFTVLFGSIDLVIQTPQFFRLEPCVQNFIIGTLLFVCWLAKIPIGSHFNRALPPLLRADESALPEGYLHRLTLVWAIYLYIKGIFFLYLAFTVDLGRLIVLRSVMGGVTLFMLVAGELVYRKRIARARE